MTVITRLEQVVVQFMQWRMHPPTPNEFLMVLLHVANNKEDFSIITSKANEYVLFCSTIVDSRCEYASSTIALAALNMVLEEIGYGDFAGAIRSFIIDKGLAFDLDAVPECIKKIRAT